MRASFPKSMRKLMRGRTVRLKVTMLMGIVILIACGTMWIALHTQDTTFSLVALLTGLASVLVVTGTLGIIIRHFAALERLRGGIVGSQAEDVIELPAEDMQENHEVEELRQAVNALLKARLARRRRAQEGLGAVLSVVGEAVVVVTEDGLITLVNGRATSLLGAVEVACGTSVFAALQRAPFLNALEQLRGTAGPVEAELLANDGRSLSARLFWMPERKGVVISIADRQAQCGPLQQIDHALDLHEPLPAASPASPDTLLEDLPSLVFDLETTGLNVKTDRIVSIGGVRMHGPRIFRDANVDRLVDPGCPIPEVSARVHGITDDMVAGAGDFAGTWPTVRGLFDGVVLVGHNVAFDIAHMRRATGENGFDWQPVGSLDTLLLTGALEPDMPHLDLESVALRYGVDVTGRHTALGDSLVTAGIFARLIARLHDQGIRTLGEAVAFQESRDDLIDLQRRSGWFDG